MHIYCPKCGAGYEIDEELIEDQAKKLKCSNCGEIFAVAEANWAEKTAENNDEAEPFELLHAAMSEENDETPAIKEQDEKDDASDENTHIDTDVVNNYERMHEEDVVTEKVDELEDANTNENNLDTALDAQEQEDAVKQQTSDDSDENVNLENIFMRLSEHTEHLMEQEKKLPFYEKLWLQIKNILGFHFKIRWAYVALFVTVFVLLSLFNNRYQIVREIPALNSLYKVFGINAKIPGEGLEFQNIGWEFFDDEVSRLEIKGFVYNNSERDVALPMIHIEMLDKDTVLLQSQNRESETKVVESHAKIPLNLVVENPAPTTKYVYLTFIEAD